MNEESDMINTKQGDGAMATAEAGGRHLRLKVEYMQTGWVVEVFETDGNSEVEREMVDSLDVGKLRAEEIAKSYLADKDLKLPAIEWKDATTPEPLKKSTAQE
jgi:hypothetical protein